MIPVVAQRLSNFFLRPGPCLKWPGHNIQLTLNQYLPELWKPHC